MVVTVVVVVVMLVVVVVAVGVVVVGAKGGGCDGWMRLAEECKVRYSDVTVRIDRVQWGHSEHTIRDTVMIY